MNMRYVIDNYIAQGREEAEKEYEAVLAEKNRTIVERDRTIAEQNHTIGLMMQELRELRLRANQA